MPPRVNPPRSDTPRVGEQDLQAARSEPSSTARTKFSDSSIVRRSHITVTAARAPMANAMRQPQACIWSAVSNC